MSNQSNQQNGQPQDTELNLAGLALPRRNFLRMAVTASASLALSEFCWPQENPASAPAKPNILFIAIDDQNDWVGCLGGHPNAKTPNIDQLASEGVVFTNAHCTSPACVPSRFSLLSGRTPLTTAIWTNGDVNNVAAAAPKYVMLPQFLKSNGYHTMGAGKVYHGSGFPEGSRGGNEYWDEYKSGESDERPASRKTAEPGAKKRTATSKPARKNGLTGLKASIDWGPVEEENQDTKTALWAVKQLEKDHDKPFFLAAGFHKPHLPWYAPKKYFDMHPLGSIVLPEVKMDDLDDCDMSVRSVNNYISDFKTILAADPEGKTKWKEAVQGYLACGSYADDCAGMVLDALRKSKYYDNTIVVLWSDHGWHLGEKTHWRKFTLWEESTRTPMIFAGPGISKGAACSRTVNLLDIYPTLMTCCGFTPPEDLEGNDLAALLQNPTAPWSKPSISYEAGGHLAVRTEEWRYILYQNGSEELYDHRIGADGHVADPNEWNNLAADPQYSAIKARMRALLPKIEPGCPTTRPTEKDRSED